MFPGLFSFCSQLKKKLEKIDMRLWSAMPAGSWHMLYAM
jgi:hypothetical protein